MNIPEGFTPRGDSNEQPPETYDGWVSFIMEREIGLKVETIDKPARANNLHWKVPSGPLRIIAWRLA